MVVFGFGEIRLIHACWILCAWTHWTVFPDLMEHLCWFCLTCFRKMVSGLHCASASKRLEYFRETLSVCVLLWIIVSLLKSQSFIWSDVDDNDGLGGLIKVCGTNVDLLKSNYGWRWQWWCTALVFNNDSIMCTAPLKTLSNGFTSSFLLYMFPLEVGISNPSAFHHIEAVFTMQSFPDS